MRTEGIEEMEKNCKKQFFHQTHLYLSPLEHRNGGHNGLLLKPEEAPGLNDSQKRRDG